MYLAQRGCFLQCSHLSCKCKDIAVMKASALPSQVAMPGCLSLVLSSILSIEACYMHHLVLALLLSSWNWLLVQPSPSMKPGFTTITCMCLSSCTSSISTEHNKMHAWARLPPVSPKMCFEGGIRNEGAQYGAKRRDAKANQHLHVCSRQPAPLQAHQLS